MKALFLRCLSAIFLAPLVLYSVYSGNPLFLICMTLFICIALWEWSNICWAGELTKRSRLLWLLAGSIYILVSGACYLFLHEDNVNTIYFILLIVWISDTAAFIFGNWLGGAKLAPRISPKKTWSGFFGAIISSGLIAGLCTSLFPDKTLIYITLAGMSLGCIAQLGDLLESFAKRVFSVKDSSNLIPGHGGILDRIDGLLAVGLTVSVINGSLLNELSQWL